MSKYSYLIFFYLIVFTSCRYSQDKSSQINANKVSDAKTLKDYDFKDRENECNINWAAIKRKAQQEKLSFQDYASVIPSKKTPISYTDYLNLLVKINKDNDTIYTYLINNILINDSIVIYSSGYEFSSIKEALKLKAGNILEDICYDGDFLSDFMIPESSVDLNKIMPKSEEGIAFIAPIFKFSSSNLITIAYVTVYWNYSPFAEVTLKSYNQNGDLLNLENNYLSLISSTLAEGEYSRKHTVVNTPTQLETEEINYIFSSIYEDEATQGENNINQSNVFKVEYVLKAEGWIEDKRENVK